MSTNQTQRSTGDLVPVKFSRLTRRGILLGLSLGAMLGDIVAAFFKRRLRMKRGAPLVLIDQIDFVIGAWLLTMLIAPLWFWHNFTPLIMIIVLIITPILHRITNIIGYKIGAKREPW